MSDVILWRHADAEPGIRDLERPLTRKGEKQAGHVARWLHDRLPPTALVCASPAKRAQQTALALVRLQQREVRTVDAFAPGVRFEVALAALRSLERTRTVVVVGHQPTLGELAAHLLRAQQEDWSIRKGSLVWLTEKEGEAGGQVVLRAAISPDLV